MTEIERPDIKIELPEVFPLTQGGGGWPLIADAAIPYAWRSDLFTLSEIEAIREIGQRLTFYEGRTGSVTQDKAIRDSMIHFIYPNIYTEWIFSRLTDGVMELNQRFFGLDLHGFDQGIQFTRYTAPSEHYDWHVDRGPGTGVRKLSIVLQLSDPSTYKGGALQFQFGSHDKERAPKAPGTLIAFPSFTRHRVTQVREGVRESLVAWLGGPPLR